MRSPTIRHVVHLHLALIGVNPPITREVVVDRDLVLGALPPVLQSLFGLPSCAHHLFTDSPGEGGWSRQRRRWGDRWTMIDFHDPTVVDESTVRIGGVIGGGKPLYFSHTCDGNGVVRIEAGMDDVVAASDPPVRVVAGTRRALFTCSRNPYEHEVLVGILDDPGHPDHAALRTRVETAVGPWATFAPEEFDVSAAQLAVDAVLRGTAPPGARDTFGFLTRCLPTLARAGLRAHLATTGIDLPTVMTTSEATLVTRVFRRVIDRAGDGGVALVDGGIDPAAIREDARLLGLDEERMRSAYAAARQLRLVYSRSGRLVAKKSILAVESPSQLFDVLAEEVSHFSAGYSDSAARGLFLLAIADGSLADRDRGITSVATAYALVEGGSGYGAYHHWDGDLQPYCEPRCDCPPVNGTTWHSIVAKAVRDAAAAAIEEGGVTVATRHDHRDGSDFGLTLDWLDEGYSPIRAVHDRARGGWERRTRSGGYLGDDETNDAAEGHEAESRMLRAAASVIDLLSLFGLSRAEDGAWIVPPTLQEFARAALRAGAARSGTGVY